MVIDPPPHAADLQTEFSLALFNIGILHGSQFSVPLGGQAFLPVYILPVSFEPDKNVWPPGLTFLKKPLKPAAQAKTQGGTEDQAWAGMSFYRYQRFIDYISDGSFADRFDFIGGLAADVAVEFLRLFQFNFCQAHRLCRQMDLRALVGVLGTLFGVSRSVGRFFGLIVLCFGTHDFSPIYKFYKRLWKSTLSPSRIKASKGVLLDVFDGIGRSLLRLHVKGQIIRVYPRFHQHYMPAPYPPMDCYAHI
jgi:hypothetical protein